MRPKVRATKMPTSDLVGQIRYRVVAMGVAVGSRAGRLLLILAVGAALAFTRAVWFARPASAASSSETVFVAGATVFGYDAGSHGSVSPIRELENPNLPNTFWDPWGVAFDQAGDAYVQSFLSYATTFVFGPGAGRGAQPIRIFDAHAPDTRSIAVDGAGFEYVDSGNQVPPVIAVAAVGASGQPSNGYSVAPVRTFASGETGFNPWPDILSVDSANDLLVGEARSDSNDIATYAGGAAGGSTALRVLQGTKTGLGSCPSVGGVCDHLSIAFSPDAGSIYAAVSGGGTPAHISAFKGGTSGNAAPIQTIEGGATGLQGKVITGIAASQLTGEIYVMVKPTRFAGPAEIEVFDPHANGNVAPLRTFTDAATAFADASGIAIHAG
jgi:hypothetical protein